VAKLDANTIVARRLEKKLIKSSAQIEKEIFELVQRLLREFDIKDGQFVPDNKARQILAKLNKELRKIVDTSQIEDEVRNFIDDFDLIDKNIKIQQEQLNGIQVSQKIFNTQRIWAVDNTLESLVNSQIDLKFINPAKQLLYSRIAFGGSVVDAERQLRDLIIGIDSRAGVKDQFGILTRWIGQVARDTINEYTGTVNAEIKAKYELNALRYVGGLLDDSRPQCMRWVNEYKGILKDSDLLSEIDWAYKNGSGMKPDTTPENFPQKRGGYNCIHDAIPFRIK